ncbi:MAG: response regulator [Phenylobacterium sp.]|nr:response regulator [Phenylobacterium sp.]
MIAAAAYYAIVAVSHPFFETGAALVVLDSLAVVTAAAAAGFWLRLGRGKMSAGGVEAISGLVYLLFLINIVAYHAFHFEEQKLIYFSLLALVCGTTASTDRLAYLSVGASLACLVFLGARYDPGFINNFGYIGLASGFAALGMATLMRGAVIRELEARVASEALARDAQAASRAKSAFLATMSHEIRTPLNGVLGMVQAMDAGRLEIDQRDRLHVIQESAQALLGVLNDVLDMAQIESGRAEIRPNAFRLDVLADSLRRLYEPLAAEKGLGFQLDLEGEGAAWRWGDAGRLRQIVSNLISNALKFTEQGEIRVVLRLEGEHLTGAVEDTGVGMSPEAQASIFERFVQVDDTITRRIGGTGLGLAISRDLAQLMGGDIWCRSEPGRGSTFTLRLPLPAAEGAADPDAGAEPEVVATGRVLVVDDNPTNRLVLGALLGGLGMSHGVACDGVEALESFASETWDAILMDVHMPHMDGLAAARAIRAREEVSGRLRTPIVAVTASVLSHEVDGYLEAGMDAVLAKPIQLSALAECLGRLETAQTEREADRLRA